MHLKSIFELEELVGCSLVTPEMQICTYLYIYGPQPSMSLLPIINLSPSGFYNCQKRLKEKGVIIGRQSDEDLRVVLYDLSDCIRSKMNELFGDAISSKDGDGVADFMPPLLRKGISGFRKWPNQSV